MSIYSKEIQKIIDEIKKVVVGKDDIIIKVLIALLARGHILIEDIPGVGKTTLALAFSKTMELSHKRLQFTPDVLPTDVVGFNMLDKDNQDLNYKEGAVMCNLFLADEINRTSPKTQSALLEVMEEGQVTVDSITRKLPKPFFVIATQNPIGSIGTQMLPESQLDRFMIRLTMGYPDIISEIEMLKRRKSYNPLNDVNIIINKRDILLMQDQVDLVYIHDSVYEYIANLVMKTRVHSLVELGVSPRGTIALTNMAKATAFIYNRDFVIPEDVKTVFADVVTHRIKLKPKARVNNVTVKAIVEAIVAQVKPPKVG